MDQGLMFSPNDTIKCTNNERREIELTFGKVYSVIGLNEDRDLVTVLNDKNQPESYFTDRFILVTNVPRPRGSDVQPQTPAGARVFGTGATRDLDANKLDFEGFLSPLVLERYAEHMHKARKMPDGTMRDSDNWQLGIPVDVYMKSMWRHFFAVWKLHRGLKVTEMVNGVEVVKDLETELCALQFNVSGMLHETLKAKQND
jgi:hypothetical protein